VNRIDSDRIKTQIGNLSEPFKASAFQDREFSRETAGQAQPKVDPLDKEFSPGPVAEYFQAIIARPEKRTPSASERLLTGLSPDSPEILLCLFIAGLYLPTPGKCSAGCRKIFQLKTCSAEADITLGPLFLFQGISENIHSLLAVTVFYRQKAELIEFHMFRFPVLVIR
jgi:hypothetical protein